MHTNVWKWDLSAYMTNYTHPEVLRIASMRPHRKTPVPCQGGETDLQRRRQTQRSFSHGMMTYQPEGRGWWPDVWRDCRLGSRWRRQLVVGEPLVCGPLVARTGEGSSLLNYVANCKASLTSRLILWGPVASHSSVFPWLVGVLCVSVSARSVLIFPVMVTSVHHDHCIALSAGAITMPPSRSLWPSALFGGL